MAFTPFVETDRPSMANFNQKFLDAIQQATDDAVGEAPKIATGSYAGTGAAHTISLTFDFPIEFFFISALDTVAVDSITRDFSSGYYLAGSKRMIVFEQGLSAYGLPITLSDDRKTISWAGSASSNAQERTFNALTTYYYKAIG